jgi:predicted 3-demethylubiquinone-9 3-methyltransferase (glyoxalase superfamily)
MDHYGKELFEKWFKDRFGVSWILYHNEWQERFESGHPWTWMDSQSMDLFIALIHGK